MSAGGTATPAPTWVRRGAGGAVLDVAHAADSPGEGWEAWTDPEQPVRVALPEPDAAP